MQETKVIAQKVNSKFFNYCADEGKEKQFVCEASDLPSYFNPNSQVWNDACDAGFLMVSEHTGAEVLFCFKEEARDREGELFLTIYEAVEDFNYGIINKTYTAVILND